MNYELLSSHKFKSNPISDGVKGIAVANNKNEKAEKAQSPETGLCVL